MLDRLSKRRQESGVHPHEWDIRHSSLKRLRSRSSNDFPSVPSPIVFRDVSIPYSLTRRSTAPPTFEQYPAPGHVASHLLFVECLSKLRTEIEASPLLDIDLQDRDRRLGIEVPKSKFSTWTSYLNLAIDRFRLWITRIESVIRHSAVFNRYGTGSHLHGAFTENYLPPLDVLFVWYCYLQSPAAYERLIASNDFRLLSQICFPWHLFPNAIDQDTLEYVVPPAARALWDNLISIPFDLENCIEADFVNESPAFMSASAEILEIALRQSELMQGFQQYQWLRSPALNGTIRRAMSSYTERIMDHSSFMIENTQQIPLEGLESRTTEELDLDLPAQLILHTHRAFHSAWQIFAQLNNLKDDDTPPPPSYEESNERNQRRSRSKLKIDVQNISGSQPCYCWVCERIKDEAHDDLGGNSMILGPLSQVSSPDDEKRTVTSVSSSDSDSDDDDNDGSSLPTQDLTKKQIKTIKADVAIFRYAESLRLKKMAR